MTAAVVRAHVGAGAALYPIDRTVDSAMNLVLDLALEASGLDEVEIFWVDGGLPEHFSVVDTSPPAVVFSSRYVEVAALFHRLIRADFLTGDLLAEAAERLSLRTIAELMLSYGDPQTAVYLFLRSVVGETIAICWASSSPRATRPTWRRGSSACCTNSATSRWQAPIGRRCARTGSNRWCAGS